jgi:hypothetical protein
MAGLVCRKTLTASSAFIKPLLVGYSVFIAKDFS